MILVLTNKMNLLKKSFIPICIFSSSIENFFKILIFLWIFSLIHSCSTEIEINGDSPATPVVYCFLNPDDSVQYLRLSKTFTIPVTDPRHQPSDSEMIYSEEPEIYLEANGSGFKQRFYKCTIIDTIQKDQGWFPVKGMQLYATKCKIEPSSLYSLVVFFHSENRIVFGQTRSFGSALQIYDPTLLQFRDVDLFPGQDYYVRFSAVTNAQIYQTTLSFLYDEIKGGKPVRKEFRTRLEPLLNENPDVEYLQQRISGLRFLTDLSRGLTADSGVIRKPVCFNFQVSCGGIELATNIQSEEHTSAFSQIIYSNLDNAQGLFSSLNHRYVNNVPISRFTIDSIAKSYLTRNLGFLSFKDLLMNEKATELHRLY